MVKTATVVTRVLRGIPHTNIRVVRGYIKAIQKHSPENTPENILACMVVKMMKINGEPGTASMTQQGQDMLDYANHLIEKHGSAFSEVLTQRGRD